MGKEHYIEELHRQLQEIMERPVTLGRAEEVTVYVDAICAMGKLGEGHLRGAAKEPDFTEADAKAWAAKMQNADGTTGPHWTMEQTSAVAESMGIPPDKIPRWAWGVAMNMMYSDYYDVATQYGVNRPEFYAALAKAFLCDKDGPGPERKLMEYYEHVVL